MTREEARKQYANGGSYISCCDCPLAPGGSELCDKYNPYGCSGFEDAWDAIAEYVTKEVEGTEKSANHNPYWDNITKLANKQREKGLRDYGQGLEDNPAAILDRLTHIEEELIDALMYLEWLKEGIVNEQN